MLSVLFRTAPSQIPCSVVLKGEADVLHAVDSPVLHFIIFYDTGCFLQSTELFLRRRLTIIQTVRENRKETYRKYSEKRLERYRYGRKACTGFIG